ncbi:Capsular glucan synthase [uncultured Clostridium sp.]|uniref:glycosyltransferase family 4 protein n=1 Tax=uncultured Clostridium sp. TaxID=59620 RepID=UPI000820C69B|nr:glycosyltransferase family 4 protein [uncultured Clostridium sp.]SCJ36926.1 Capsular glucan synthase [uncultured Clostridium sp.]
MKIAMIGHKRIPSREGGVEIVVEELTTRMVNLGHDVTCYNRGGKHVLNKSEKVESLKEYKGVKLEKVLTIDIRGLAAMTSSFFGTFKILFSKSEIVHFHAEGTCVMIPIIKIFSRKKVITTIHGLDWQRAKWGVFASKYIKFGEKMAAKYADEIIVLSENVKGYFKEQYKRDTYFVPNGVSKPKIIKANIIKKKYKLTKDSYLLFLGRIVPEKGIHYLIDAYQQVAIDKKLVIAGAASDTDSYYKELKDKAKDNVNIIFTGFVQGDELEELYSNAYVYILPSDLEGMPLSLLEAMSYGNCCLTSDIPECATVIGGNGVTFKKSKVTDLMKKLQELSDDKVKKYKQESQRYILKRYSWDDIVDRTLKLYEK